MITQKLKKCSGCEQDKYIYKRIGGKPYCKSCAYKVTPKKVKSATTRTISPKSEKRIIQEKQYATLRKKFLSEHPYCAGKLNGCTGYNVDTLTIQHKRGRVGSLFLDIRYWIPLCLTCHIWVNEHPKEAEELGLAESRLNKD